MTPSPRRFVVVKLAQRPALWTRPLNPNGMIQENVNLALFQFQFHAFDIPRIGNPENLSIELSVLNGCSPLGASPVKLDSAWAEDRAMLGSNPSADSGPKTEAGCLNGIPFRILINLGIGTKAINPGGLGAGPQVHYPPKTRNSHPLWKLFAGRECPSYVIPRPASGPVGGVLFNSSWRAFFPEYAAAASRISAAQRPAQ